MEAPVFDALPDIHSFTNSGSCSAVVYFNATATDNCDNSTTVTCNPLSGSTFDMGLTRVNCSAVDTAGNIQEDFFTVNVTGTL